MTVTKLSPLQPGNICRIFPSAAHPFHRTSTVLATSDPITFESCASISFLSYISLCSLSIFSRNFRAFLFYAIIDETVPSREENKTENSMKTSDFNYYLPEELIAQTPVEPRDASRLMTLDKKRVPSPIIISMKLSIFKSGRLPDSQ